MIMNQAPERSLPDRAIAELYNGKKIEAIKIVREHYNLQLVEAKGVVEQYIAQNPALAEKFAAANNNALIFVVAGLVVCLGIAWVMSTL